MTHRPAARRRPDGRRRGEDGEARAFLALLSLVLLQAPGCAPPDRSPADTEVPAGLTGGPPLTSAERAGEQVYRREGCARCHTQRDAPPSSGPADLPGPPAVGPIASRVGPDLGLEGHRRSDDWQQAHLYAPDIVVPGSRMPPSRHLFRAGAAGGPEPSEDALHLVAYLQALGRTRRDVWAEFRSQEPRIPAPEKALEEGRLERGKRLYAEHCVPCHGVAGDGRGPAAALLLFPPRDFTAGRYRFRSVPSSEAPADADLFRVITLGTGTGSAMPGFHFLSAEERWALVLRVREFSPVLRGAGLHVGTATGAPSPPAGDLAALIEGRDLWARLECASCHGPEGRGLTREEAGARWADPDGVVVPRSGDLTHPCSRRGGGSEEAFARALRFGVGSPMPSFADELEQPLGAARALLRHLQERPEAPRVRAPAVPDPAGTTSPDTRNRR